MNKQDLYALVQESLDEVLNEVTFASSLVKNKEYRWTMGGEPMDITYIGTRKENPDIKVGSSVGKGYIFQWDDGRYLEIGPITLRQNVKEFKSKIKEDMKDDITPDYNNETSREEFIQSNGGTVHALKFKSAEDVENMIHKIRDKFNLHDVDPNDPFSEPASDKFKDIFGISPIKLMDYFTHKNLKEDMKGDRYDEGYNAAKTKYKKLAEAYKKLKEKSILKEEPSTFNTEDEDNPTWDSVQKAHDASGQKNDVSPIINKIGIAGLKGMDAFNNAIEMVAKSLGITLDKAKELIKNRLKEDGFGLDKTTPKDMNEARFKKGEDVGKKGPGFKKVAKVAAKEYGSKEAGQKVAGAVLKKVLAKKK